MDATGEISWVSFIRLCYSVSTLLDSARRELRSNRTGTLFLRLDSPPGVYGSLVSN